MIPDTMLALGLSESSTVFSLRDIHFQIRNNSAVCISSLRRETLSAVGLVCIIILLPVAVNESRRTNRKSQNVDISDGNARTAKHCRP